MPPDGTTQTKSQLLADMKSGDLVIESSEMSDMKVRAYGDAAVVTYMTNDKGKSRGRTSPAVIGGPMSSCGVAERGTSWRARERPYRRRAKK